MAKIYKDESYVIFLQGHDGRKLKKNVVLKEILQCLRIFGKIIR